MLKIGLTGNIGSGKSTVARVFEALGVPMFYADAEAKKCYFNDQVKSHILASFGNDAYLNPTTLNTKYIAGIVFSDPKWLAHLNSIIHPQLRLEFVKWAENMARNHTVKYIVMEAAILFENNFDDMVDQTVCISAPKNQRIDRVLRRDNISEELIELRMKNQWPDSQLKEKSDFVLYNRDRSMILAKILQLHSRFCL